MQQSGNAMGNDSGFSATGTGKDEERTFDELYRLLLRLVQAFEKMFGDFRFHEGYYIRSYQSRNHEFAQTELAATGTTRKLYLTANLCRSTVYYRTSR